MIVLALDIEGSYGATHPSQEGFYTTCCGMVTFDTETNTTGEKIVWIDHVGIMTADYRNIIQKIVDNADLVVGQNLKYDIQALMYYGVDFSHKEIWDTWLAEWMLSGQDKFNYPDFKLETICKKRGVEGKKGADEVREYWEAGIETREIPVGILEKYQIGDCYAPLNVFFSQLEEAKKENMYDLLKLHMEWTHVLLEMEYTGLNFDKERALELYDEYKEKADEIQNYFREVSGVEDLSLSSNQQKSALIHGGVVKIPREVWEIKTFKHHSTYRPYQRRVDVEFKGLGFARPTNPKFLRGLPAGTVAKKEEIDYWIQNGAYWATNKAGIEQLSARTKKLRDYKELLLQHSKYTKIYETLIGVRNGTGLIPKIAADGKIYPSLNQEVAVTGRLSSSDPNGQNLFKIIKECFIPSNDYIGQHDLSQVEWRTAMEVSGDPIGIAEVNSGIDQHAATVTDLMELEFKHKGDPKSDKNRNNAKTFNFRMIFRGSHWGFFLDHKMPNFKSSKWAQIVESFWEKYNGLWQYHLHNERLVKEGKTPRAITGRKFVFNKIAWEDGERCEDKNQIANYYIQGPCADILALMGVVIRRGMRNAGLLSKMVLTVHDSIVFDIVKGEEEKIKKLCYGVSNNLKSYIKSYFKIDWSTNLEGEFEIGPNYKDLSFVPPDKTCREKLQILEEGK